MIEDNGNKEKALSAALAQIERQFGKGSMMRLGDTERVAIPAISTGSLGLDIALGIGGLPRGRIVEIYGPESSGKTTLTLQVIAEAQKAGGTCAFIDAEHALDPIYADNLGVDVDDNYKPRYVKIGARSKQINEPTNENLQENQFRRSSFLPVIPIRTI